MRCILIFVHWLGFLRKPQLNSPVRERVPAWLVCSGLSWASLRLASADHGAAFNNKWLDGAVQTRYT